MTATVFEQWFAELLIPFVEGKRAETMKPSHPALLLLDGHSSHETLYTLELAKENKIISICLPPHMTHLLQPMDVSFFKSLKSAWDQECEAYARDPANGGKFVTKPTFCSVLSKAWQKTSRRKENVTNGFRKCGIFPVKKMTLEELTPQRKLNPADALQRAGPETQDEDIHDTTNEQTDKSTGETTAQTEMSTEETAETTEQTETSTEETPETTEQTETSTEETPETTEQTETSSEETPETTAQTETPAEESPETTAQTGTSTDESPETTEQKETSTEETPEKTETSTEETPETTEQTETSTEETPETTEQTEMLTEERQKTTTNPKTTEQIKTLTEETQQITEQTDMSITEASQKDIEEPQKTNEQTETSKDKITKNTARAMSTGETHKTLEEVLKLPTFIRKASLTKRKTNPYSRVLTSSEVIEEKRKKLQQQEDEKKRKRESGRTRSQKIEKGCRCSCEESKDGPQQG